MDQKSLLGAGENSEANILTRAEVESLFGLPAPGKFKATGPLEGYRKRKQLVDNYNEKKFRDVIKQKYYTKHAERYPPIV